jgi:hypothetical protein
MPPIYTGAASATDGSGYVVSVNELGNPKVTVKTRSGWTIPNPGTSTGKVIDTNGNFLSTAVNGSTTTFTDTLGTTVLTVNVVSPSQTTYTYTGPSGSAQYSFNYSQHSVQTNFGCSTVLDYPATPIYLLDSITLPDSSQYTFTYESTPGVSGKVTGRIASVTLSTGGQITYQYQGGNNGILCADGTTATLRRTTPDGTWTYAHTESGSAWTTTIDDSSGQPNRTILNFQGIYETQRRVYQGTGTLLQTTVTCYNGSTTNCNTTAITLPITRRTMWQQLPDSAGLQSKTDTFFNSLGLVTEVDQYAYGSGAPGALLRKTLISYGSWNGTQCVSLGNNILDRPCQTIVQDGSANVIAKTAYAYDEYAVSANSGTPPQHQGVTGSRGNLTTVTSYSSTNGSLSRHFNYYDTGTVNVATDVNGAQTTYGYSASSCGYSFPTSITLPVTGLSRSMAYNCTGGVMTSGTDENSKVTSLSYNDAFWRVTARTDPTTAVTNYGYANFISGVTNPYVSAYMDFNVWPEPGDRHSLRFGQPQDDCELRVAGL